MMGIELTLSIAFIYLVFYLIGVLPCIQETFYLDHDAKHNGGRKPSSVLGKPTTSARFHKHWNEE